MSFVVVVTGKGVIAGLKRPAPGLRQTIRAPVTKELMQMRAHYITRGRPPLNRTEVRMLDLTDIAALRSLRTQFEESAAPDEYPASCASELLLLADVCAVLGLSDQAAREVIGDTALTYLTELTGGPAGAPGEAPL